MHQNPHFQWKPIKKPKISSSSFWRSAAEAAACKFAATPSGGQGVMRILFPCFLDLYKPQRELRGDPPRPPTLSKKRPKIQRKITSNKNSQLFSKMEPNGSPLGPEILPKSIKSQTKALEALTTKDSERQLEKVSLQTPPGPLNQAKSL